MILMANGLMMNADVSEGVAEDLSRRKFFLKKMLDISFEKR